VSGLEGMNRSRRLDVFRVSTGEHVWSGEYDPVTTIFTEALEASGVPDLAEAAAQSHHIDGDDWVWSREGLRCRDFVLRHGDDSQRGSAPSEVEEVVAKDKPNKTKPKTPSQPPKGPAMKVESLMRELKVQLTAAEVAERADRAAKLLEDRDRAEAELKAYATTVKSRIATMEAEMRELSSEVRSHFTYRDVPVERRYLYAIGQVEEARLDTGEIISERPMTERERQQPLPFTGDTTLTEHGFTDQQQDTAAE
jgi:hypothetical protein